MKKRWTAPKRPMQHHKETILHKMKVPEGREKEREKEKYLKKINAWGQPNFDERYKYMHPIISTISSRITSERAIPQNIMIKLLKVKDQERKSWKQQEK